MLFLIQGQCLANSSDLPINAGDLSSIGANFRTPAAEFALSVWKLQIPGPLEVFDLKNYASNFFYLNADNQMCFWVDCTATGHTKNSEYVRSELRHVANWDINSDHTMSATLKVISHADPSKVTVLQIHGITAGGGNAPPLLRIALNDGNLYAFIKTDNSGNRTDRILLVPAINEDVFTCTVKVEDKNLIISVNGVEKVNRSLDFWEYKNYFKAGCYPQSHSGTVNVVFSKLSVN